MTSFDRWLDKVAIVTGASAGIGADIAEELTKRGLKVVGLARRSELIEERAKKLAHAKGKLYGVKCDVSNEEDILKAFQWVKENVGPVHILINNAGIVRNTNLIDGDSDKWRKVFDVNVLGLLIATREAIKVMKENNIDGHIININSVAGHYDLPLIALNVYSASKHAVTTLTENFRREFNENNLKIKITSVSPGYVNTEAFQNNEMPITPEFQTLTASLSLNPDDITEGVIYALSTKPHVQIHEIMIRPVGEQF